MPQLSVIDEADIFIFNNKANKSKLPHKQIPN